MEQEEVAGFKVTPWFTREEAEMIALEAGLLLEEVSLGLLFTVIVLHCLHGTWDDVKPALIIILVLSIIYWYFFN